MSSGSGKVFIEFYISGSSRVITMQIKNMLMLLGIISIFIVIFIVSCTPQVVCNKPYILVGKDCCLDMNDNKICDKDDITGDIEIKKYTPEEKTEYGKNLDKLDKVCIVTSKEYNQILPNTIIECSSDQECLDYVYSLSLADTQNESEARETMKQFNIRCDKLTEEEKEEVITNKKLLEEQIESGVETPEEPVEELN